VIPQGVIEGDNVVVNEKTDIKQGLGIKERLLLFTLPTVLIVFLGVWFIVVFTARKGLNEMSDQNLALTSVNLADTMTQIINDTHADAQTSGRLDLAAAAIDELDSKNIDWYAEELVQTRYRYAAIVVTDHLGVIIGANKIDRFGKALSKELHTRKITDTWFEETLNSKVGVGVVIHPQRPEFLKDLLGPNERVMGLSLPIHDLLGYPIGTLTVLLSTHFLSERFASTLLTSGGSVDSMALLVDKEGVPVAMPLKTPNAEAWAKAKVISKNAVGEPLWMTPDGAMVRLSEAPIKGIATSWGWRLVTMKTAEILERPVEAITARLRWAFVVGLAILSFILFVLARKFVGPITRLTHALLGTGKAAEFEGLQVETTDEVGTLTQTFNKMMLTIQDYEKNLEDKVKERTAQLFTAKKEVSDILDNMTQGIFTVSQGCVINNEFSAYTKTIFGDRPIAGENALDLLHVTEKNDRETYTAMEFWFRSIFGGDELQWMLTEEDVITDTTYTRGEGDDAQERHLKVEFNPIYEDGLIQKVMVVARDVSDVVGLEAEVVEKEQRNVENINRAAEISNMDPDLFETFIDESWGLIEVCEETTNALASDLSNMDGINKLFRSMHTLKGNARIFKITTIQDMAHSVEDYFQKVRDGEVELDVEVVEEVKNQVGLVRNLMKEFEILGRRILFGETTVLGDEKSASPLQVLLNDANTYVTECNDQLVRYEDNHDSSILDKLRASSEALKNTARNVGVSSLVIELDKITGLLEGGGVSPGALAETIGVFQESVTRTEAGAIAVQACTMLENFIEESEALLDRMNQELEAWKADVSNRDKINVLMRSTHSFKANARTFGIGMVQAAAHTMEDDVVKARDDEAEPTAVDAEKTEKHMALIACLLNDCRALSGATVATDGLTTFLVEAKGLLARVTEQAGKWVGDLASRAELDALFRVTHSYKAVARKFNFTGMGAALHAIEDQLDLARQSEPVDPELARNIHLVLKQSVKDLEVYESVGRQLASMDKAKQATLVDECRARQEQLGKNVEAWKTDAVSSDKLNALFRTIHSVKAYAQTYAVLALQTATHTLEDRLDILREQEDGPTADDFASLEPRFLFLLGFLSDVPVLLQTALAQGGEETDQVTNNVAPFAEEARLLLGKMDEQNEAWDKAPAQRDRLDALFRTLHSFKATARRFKFPGLEKLSHGVEDLLDQSRQGEELDLGLGTLARQRLRHLTPLLNIYESVANTFVGRYTDVSLGSAAAPAAVQLRQVNAIVTDTQTGLSIVEALGDTLSATTSIAGVLAVAPNLVEFLQEGPGLLEKINAGYGKWKTNPGERGHLDALFRDVHSFKAGARRFKFGALVSWIHSLEDVLDAAREEKDAVEPKIQEAGAVIEGLDNLLHYYSVLSSSLQNVEGSRSAAIHFVNEARGLLERIDQSAQDWVNEPGKRDHLDALFRVVHSYKACARRYKFLGLESLVHKLEDDLDAARSGPELDQSQAAPMRLKMRALSQVLNAYQAQAQDLTRLSAGKGAIAEFAKEAAPMLASMSEAGAAWASGTGDGMDALFIVVHSFKACSRRFGLTGIETEVHKLEDKLDAIRQGASADATSRALVLDDLGQLSEIVNLHVTLSGGLAQIADGQVAKVVSELAKRHTQAREKLEQWAGNVGESDLVNGLFREVNSYKAEAKNSKLEDLQERLHHFEDLLSTLRDREAAPEASDLQQVEFQFSLFDSAVADLKVLSKRSDEEEDEDEDDILEQFLDESKDRVIVLQKGLVAWKEDVDNVDHVHTLFRTMHSLKANARTFGVRTLQDLTHALEDELVRLRESKEPLILQDVLNVERDLSVIAALIVDTSVLGRPVEQGSEREELLDQFVEECDDRNKQFSEIMSAWLASPEDRDFLNRLFRTMHSFKANARTFGVEILQDLAHSIEDKLDEMRAAQEAPTLEQVYDINARVGELRCLGGDCVELGKEAQKGSDRLVENIDQFIEDAASRCEAIRKGLGQWTEMPNEREHVNALFRAMHSLKAEARNQGLGRIQDFAHQIEDDLSDLRDSDEELTSVDVERVGSRTRMLLALVADAGRFVTILKAESETKSGGKGRKRKGKTTKVPQARVMELRKDFKDLARYLEEKGDMPEEMMGYIESIGRSVQALTQVPLGDLFERFRKMVFDLGVELGKRVNDLQVTGEDIYVDTKLIEKMRDVLIHALRNCLDHGIETPDERPDSKPEKGTISINCFWDEQDLVIEVSDDGRGVNIPKVKEKAYQKGFLKDDELDSVSQEDVVEILFRPGFSMAEKVTDVSGRGVGMDVIRSTMRELKGDAHLDTTIGEATTLALRIPADYYQAL
jgi:two-component system, chemotaxis family, sensor kinase CheA